MTKIFYFSLLQEAEDLKLLGLVYRAETHGGHHFEFRLFFFKSQIINQFNSHLSFSHKKKIQTLPDIRGFAQYKGRVPFLTSSS